MYWHTRILLVQTFWLVPLRIDGETCMKQFRVKTVIDEYGVEKHYPQFKKWFMRFLFWSDYFLALDMFSVEEIANIREHLKTYKSSADIKYHKNEKIYFFSFEEAEQFIRFVESTMPEAMTKEAVLKELKKQTIIRPINLN